MTRNSIILLAFLLLPGCTFYNGTQLRCAEELQNVSTFQYVILAVFLGIMVLSVLVALFAPSGSSGSGDEPRCTGLAIAAVSVLVVLLLCA